MNIMTKFFFDSPCSYIYM